MAGSSCATACAPVDLMRDGTTCCTENRCGFSLHCESVFCDGSGSLDAGMHDRIDHRGEASSQSEHACLRSLRCRSASSRHNCCTCCSLKSSFAPGCHYSHQHYLLFLESSREGFGRHVNVFSLHGSQYTDRRH